MTETLTRKTPRLSLDAVICDWHHTLVDCRSGFVSALAAAGKAHAIVADWAFVEIAWEMKIQVGHTAIEFGHMPWRPHEEIAREALQQTLADLGMGPARFSPASCEAILAEFARLPLWADVPHGLDALRDVLPVAVAGAESAATVREVVELRGIDVDAIFGAEMSQSFPPVLEFFRDAARRLRKPVARILYISADPRMLTAAQQVGMPTAWLQREGEFAPLPATCDPTFRAADLRQLAAELTHRMPVRAHRDALRA